MLFKKAFLFLILSPLFFAGSARANPDTIPVVDFSQLESLFHPENDSVYVVSFWATWCQPCIEELPYLEQLTRNYKDKKLRVILVSMDFKSQLYTRLIPFVEKNNVESTVVLLHDRDANTWIPKVSGNWDGAIPFTVILKGTERRERLDKFDSYQELQGIVDQLL